MTHICVMSSHKPIRIYMGGLILGVNTLYRLFCFFKLFPMVGKGLMHVTSLTCYSKNTYPVCGCLSQIVGLPYYSGSLVYKLVVVTDLSVPRKYGTYYSICDSICSPPPSQSTLLLWWLAMIPGWEGHLLQTDAAHLIHLQREVDDVALLFVAVYAYNRNFLFTCLLLGTVATSCVCV